MKKIAVLLVDDHAVVRRGLRQILAEEFKRAAFGEAWDDDNDAPGGHNGCDTRNDVLRRDLAPSTLQILATPGHAVKEEPTRHAP